MFQASATLAAPRDICREIDVPGMGEACEKADGLIRLDTDGDTGLAVHGHDYAGDVGEPAEAAGPRAPICAPAGSYRMVVVYARPSDASNRYSERLPYIRGLVADANGLLNLEASLAGATADYRVACDNDGQVQVRHEVLPTPGSADSFGSVVADLRAKGYTSTQEKIWVWYEGSVGAGIAGTGHLYWDESRSISNRNNAGAGTTSTFGVLWGWVAGYSLRTWMHENAHNMGAVQQNAPDSTGAAHCTDGQDVMCYADGGATYNPNVCTDRMHFDCGRDSYFNPDPPSGSYLANSWNIGWHGNRFLDIKATLSLGSTNVSGTESASAVLVNVTRRGVIDKDITLDWTVSFGSASADDLAGSGSHTIPSGQRNAAIAVPILDDDLVEPNETATLYITGNELGSSPPAVQITLVDDDGGAEEVEPPVGALPDLAIATKTSGPYKSEDSISPDGSGQIKGRSAKRGARAPFVLRSSNDGDTSKSFRFRVDAKRGFRVVVRDAETGKWLIGTTSKKVISYTLPPGSQRAFSVEIKVKRDARKGVRRAMRVLLRPTGETIRDVAFANVRVR